MGSAVTSTSDDRGRPAMADKKARDVMTPDVTCIGANETLLTRSGGCR
jgi:hypothetical protein